MKQQIHINPSQHGKEVLTLSEVASYTGLSKSHLYRLTHLKEIPHYKPFGKVLYFDKAEIIGWLKQGYQPTANQVQTEAANYLASGKHKGGRP